MQHGVNVFQGNTQLLGQAVIATMTTQGKDNGYLSTGDLSTQPNSQVVLLDIRSKQIEQNAKRRAMDKMMKRLGIKIVEKICINVILVVECNIKAKPVGGCKSKWLSQLRRYAMKLNPTIDDIRKQPTKELKCIKEALEATFHYVDHPLVYKHVKDQVVVVLKHRRTYLKKKMEFGEGRPSNCIEAH